MKLAHFAMNHNRAAGDVALVAVNQRPRPTTDRGARGAMGWAFGRVRLLAGALIQSWPEPCPLLRGTSPLSGQGVPRDVMRAHGWAMDHGAWTPLRLARSTFVRPLPDDDAATFWGDHA